jgi:xanthine dehydrogenase accessory factor
MKRKLLDAVLRARDEKRPCAVVSNLSVGMQTLVHDSVVEGDVGLEPEQLDEVRRAILHNRSTTVETPGGEKLFVRVYNPPLRMIIVGAVHIAQALAPMAALAGYAVTVVDPRRAFNTEARFPGITARTDWPDEALEALAPDSRTAVITLTHDPKLDDPALVAALNSPAFYVGALGSTRTHAKRLQRLADTGCDKQQMQNIHAPIGLPIGGRSPAEIAIAILAQVTQVLHTEESAA